MKTNLAVLAGFLLSVVTVSAQSKILNISYDPTRELYAEYNAAFVKHWKATTGKTIEVKTSHAGSGSQARAVIDGQPADVVTLALAYDIDAISDKAKLLPADWQSKLPHNSSPYTSTIVFVVRKGNPKGIRDWDDLVKNGVSVVTPNPKTSGGARWNYMAAWAFAHKKWGGDEEKMKAFIAQLFKNVAVLDKGARASTTTFGQRGIGDVFISWENEAFLLEKEFPGQTQIIIPTVSILAEPPVAVLEENVKKHGTAEVSKSYLEYLYSKEGQEIVAKHFYRPIDPEVASKYASKFPVLELIKIDDPLFGGWRKAQARHFDDGGLFDQIYRVK